MKKIYNAPKAMVINIKPAHSLLAGSIRINSSGSSVDASNAASRGSSFSGWGNDDEE